MPLFATQPSRLVAADGRELTLQQVHLDAEAGAGLARTRVRQTFTNRFAEPLEVTYQLPLPADGAVVDFAFVLDDRRVRGRVGRSHEARAAYEQARVEGRTAALLEQARSSVFTQQIGHLPPGAQLTAEVVVEHPLAWRDGSWEYRFPTVVAPRFHREDAHDEPPVEVEVLDGMPPARCALGLVIGDPLTAPVASPSHEIIASEGGVVLAEDGWLDRDVVVRWAVSTAEVGASVEATRPEGDAQAYALITVVPPTPDTPLEPVSRDLILLLDVSGSMSGRPMEQLRAVARSLVQSLTERDTLEMIAFSSTVDRFSDRAVSMHPLGRAQALRWIARRAAGGGTQMHDAIREALLPIREGSQRQVLLISDGLIGFETAVIGAILNDLPAGSRVHTVGVGSGVNRSLLGPAARAGGGSEWILGLDEATAPTVDGLLACTDRPLVTDLRVRGAAVSQVAPCRLPDLYAASPTRILVAYDPDGDDVRLEGRGVRGPWSLDLVLPAVTEGEGRRVVVTRFARERVEDLELQIAAGAPQVERDAEIERLGLMHQIATRRTSWVAVSDTPLVDPGTPIRRTRVPNALPYGMDPEGLGLNRTRAISMGVDEEEPDRSSARARAQTIIAFDEEDEEPQDPLDSVTRSGNASVLGIPRRPSSLAGGETIISFDEDEEEEDEPRRKLFRLPDLVARVHRLEDGRLVLEIQLPRPIDWNPGEEVDVELVDGEVGRAAVLEGTTPAGQRPAWTVVRLAIAWTEAEPPPRVWVRGRQVEVR